MKKRNLFCCIIFLPLLSPRALIGMQRVCKAAKSLEEALIVNARRPYSTFMAQNTKLSMRGYVRPNPVQAYSKKQYHTETPKTVEVSVSVYLKELSSDAFLRNLNYPSDEYRKFLLGDDVEVQLAHAIKSNDEQIRARANLVLAEKKRREIYNALGEARKNRYRALDEGGSADAKIKEFREKFKVRNSADCLKLPGDLPNLVLAARKYWDAQPEAWKDLDEGGSVDAKIKELREKFKAAVKNKADITEELKEEYDLGNIIYKKYEEVLREIEREIYSNYYEKAADQTVDLDIASYANHKLGYYYYHIVKDYSQARKYFEKVFYQQGAYSPSSAIYLGEIYYWGGKGVAMDYGRALRYYEVAAAAEKVCYQSAVTAWLSLGEMYFWAEGVEKDYSIAAKYYEKVFGSSFMTTVRPRLTSIYKEGGHGIEKNEVKAQQYSEVDPDEEHADALRNCGLSPGFSFFWFVVDHKIDRNNEKYRCKNYD